MCYFLETWDNVWKLNGGVLGRLNLLKTKRTEERREPFSLPLRLWERLWERSSFVREDNGECCEWRCGDGNGRGWTVVARTVKGRIVSWCWERGAHHDQYNDDDVLLRPGMLRGIGKGILLEVLVLEGKGFTPYKKTVIKGNSIYVEQVNLVRLGVGFLFILNSL